MSDIVLGDEKRWRNEPLGWDLVGILPQGHIGDIEEPAGRQIIGVLLQYGSKVVYGHPRALWVGVDAVRADGEEAGGRRMTF